MQVWDNFEFTQLNLSIQNIKIPPNTFKITK